MLYGIRNFVYCQLKIEFSDRLRKNRRDSFFIYGYIPTPKTYTEVYAKFMTVRLGVICLRKF